ATGGLIHITGGNDLTLHDAEEIAQQLTYELDPHADVIWGARVRKDFEGKVSVMAIMTGINAAQMIVGGDTPHMLSSEPKTAAYDSFEQPSFPSSSASRMDEVRTSGGNFDWIL
ncbi:MAG TPA: cell division protein FtsZ, partial [Methanocorpusculum sp.]|nr:cell division protein FtsZ [Methanocorpusculum sp.]